MNNNFWTKTTNYKFLGKTLFTKEEICSDTQYEGQIYNVQIRQDCFNSEFDIKKNNKEQNP